MISVVSMLVFQWIDRCARALSLAALALAISTLVTAPSLAQSAPDRDAEYRLGAGDKIRILTFGEPTLSGEFSVSGAGNVSFPLIGDVSALGQTSGELQAALEAKLRAGYLKEPKVNVEVLSYRPFYILGEVNRPGEYPYTNGLTVLNAVATANGFTYRANQKKVFIKRAGAPKEVSAPLTSDTLVKPGDTIRIGERFF